MVFFNNKEVNTKMNIPSFMEVRKLKDTVKELINTISDLRKSLALKDEYIYKLKKDFSEITSKSNITAKEVRRLEEENRELLKEIEEKNTIIDLRDREIERYISNEEEFAILASLYGVPKFATINGVHISRPTTPQEKIEVINKAVEFAGRVVKNMSDNFRDIL